MVLGHHHISHVQAARRGWSTPVKISQGPVDSEATWPAVAVTGNVTVTSVWVDDRMGPGNDLYYTFSDDGGRSWPIEDGVVYTSTQKSEGPRLARSGDGTLHAVWSWVVQPSTTTRQILYSYRTDGDWSSPVAVVTATNAVEPAVAVDSMDKVHVVWDNEPDVGNRQIYYSQSSDGMSWASPYKLSDTTGIATGPAIAVDENDDVHVVWWDITGSSSYIRYDTGGGTPGDWQVTPTELGSVSLPYIYCYPDVAVDAGGVHVVWCDFPGSFASQQVLYKERPSGEGWGTSEAIPGSRMGVFSSNPTYILPRIATGAGGGPYVVWHGKTGTEDPDENLHFAEKAGGSWVPASPIEMSPYVRDINPDLDVDSEGVIHVVWQQESGSEWDVYHSFSLNERVTLPLVMRKYPG